MLLPTLSTLSSISQDYSIISQGGVCVRPNWIDEELTECLRKDIACLRFQEAFRPSGLSNRALGDTNRFGATDRLTCTITSHLGGEFENIRLGVEEKLQELQIELQESLGRELTLSEQYYSLSPAGSFLTRHMDERHEETKGNKGWLRDTRRSISWILFLNDAGWGENGNGAGGEFRAHCRLSHAPCGANEGDLQVGWVPCSSDNRSEYEPVFLDSWVKQKVQKVDDSDSRQWRPLAALYCVQDHGRRTYLSDPFGPDSATWPNDNSLEPLEFAAALALQLPDRNFVGLEDISQINDPVNVVPEGGTLVLFDSTAVPHQVLKTTAGERLAMAGWFHEPTQDFPDWYGT